MILMIMTMLLMLMVVNRRRRVTVGTTGWTAPLLIISTGPRENQTQLMVMTTSKDAFGLNRRVCKAIIILNYNYNYFCQVWRTVLTWTIIRIGRGTT